MTQGGGGAYDFYLTPKKRDPKFHPSVACHLDGLGTKERIRNLNSVRLRELRKQEFMTSVFEGQSDDDPAALVRTFTDNVVVGIPIANEATDVLATMVSWCATYQMGMLHEHDTLIRGGVAVGDLFMDDRYVTGPALLDAVLIEHHVADVPRVVLSHESVAIAMKKSPQEREWSELLRVDSDGEVFVDYLEHYVGHSSESAANRIDLVERHRDFATNGLTDSGTQTRRIRPKYVWLAQYHNDFVTRVLGGEPELLVSEGFDDAEQRFARQFRDFV